MQLFLAFMLWLQSFFKSFLLGSTLETFWKSKWTLSARSTFLCFWTPSKLSRMFGRLVFLLSQPKYIMFLLILQYCCWSLSSFCKRLQKLVSYLVSCSPLAPKCFQAKHYISWQVIFQTLQRIISELVKFSLFTLCISLISFITMMSRVWLGSHRSSYEFLIEKGSGEIISSHFPQYTENDKNQCNFSVTLSSLNTSFISQPSAGFPDQRNCYQQHYYNSNFTCNYFSFT